MSDSDASHPKMKPGELAQPKIKLAYLEGLRGLTALYVVFFHVYQECTARREMPAVVLSSVKFIAYAEAAVAIFIVLSGYCLMLPVVQSGEGYIPGGVMNYLKRRSRRILPPYYAALVLSLLLLVLTSSLQHFAGWRWDTLSLGFKPSVMPRLDVIVSHFLLVHNWNLDWAYGINGPMWSMATEWQIYFIFPVLLLPIYRRFGIIAAVVTAFVLSWVPHSIWPEWPDYTVSPWFLGLFALGMAGAVLNFDKKLSLIYWQKRIPWGLISAALWVAAIAIVAPAPAPLGADRKLSCLVGMAALSLLIYCTRALAEGEAKRRPHILQLFEAPPVVALGKFSFSLYLTHIPVVVLVHQFLLRLHLSPPVTFFTLLIVAVPLSLLTSYLFHLKFEKPFMSSHRKAT